MSSTSSSAVRDIPFQQPFVEQVACQVPNGSVRESADGTVPLSYISAIKGGWDGALISQPVFVPAGEDRYPYHQDIVLSSEGYVSLRDIRFHIRYYPTLVHPQVYIAVRFIIADSPPTNIYDTDNIPLSSYSMVLDDMTSAQTYDTVLSRECSLPDIDRVHVPEGYNLYVCLHSNFVGSEMPLFAYMDLNWWSVLDDK